MTTGAKSPEGEAPPTAEPAGATGPEAPEPVTGSDTLVLANHIHVVSLVELLELLVLLFEGEPEAQAGLTRGITYWRHVRDKSPRMSEKTATEILATVTHLEESLAKGRSKKAALRRQMRLWDRESNEI